MANEMAIFGELLSAYAITAPGTALGPIASDHSDPCTSAAFAQIPQNSLYQCEGTPKDIFGIQQEQPVKKMAFAL